MINNDNIAVLVEHDGVIAIITQYDIINAISGQTKSRDKSTKVLCLSMMPFLLYLIFNAKTYVTI